MKCLSFLLREDQGDMEGDPPVSFFSGLLVFCWVDEGGCHMMES